jgi:hypothetical protein
MIEAIRGIGLGSNCGHEEARAAEIRCDAASARSRGRLT